MVASPDQPEATASAELEAALSGFFDPGWYVSRYPDVAGAGTSALHHFVHFGLAEGRNPNRLFDGDWYLAHYPDVGRSGLYPLLHYLQYGAPGLRNPHPRFDAAWYVDQHPAAAANPLLYHLMFGVARGWLTERSVNIVDYLPSKGTSPSAPSGVQVDVVILLNRRLARTRRCLESVLADTERPAGRVIVVDDRATESRTAIWLDRLAADGHITLLRNRRNHALAASVNMGLAAAGKHDVVLLDGDTRVPAGWLSRLAGHAYAMPRVALVSPFTNDATLCGYPSVGSPAFGLGVNELDAACQAANAGRSVEVPATLGPCLYIRRAALDDVGRFDAQAFGGGHAEESDFCKRANARGWRYLLACDTFVSQANADGFGAAAPTGPKHARGDAAEPFRFAITVELFRRFNRPVVLMLSHELGGGVRRHIQELVERVKGSASCLLLRSTANGTALSVPALPGHPELLLPADRMSDLLTVLRWVGVTRAHIHHLMGMDIDVRALLHQLGVPFDVTVHDYFAICPQVNLLPIAQGAWCGEPAIAGCNACIANRPSHGSRDIVSWRRGHAWQFLVAERVFCPSKDVGKRLARYGITRNVIMVPHEPVQPGPWPLSLTAIRKKELLRIAVIGVLAPQKGAVAVMCLTAVAAQAGLSIHVIGHAEQELPGSLTEFIALTGAYEEAELPGLLAKIKPHVVWYPSQAPETFSYTLSAAIDAGLPIVATRIGAFPERLAGRPWTWLVDPEASTEQWLATFAAVRAELVRPRKVPAIPRRPVPDFYGEHYVGSPIARGPNAPVDLRRDDRISVVVIAERFFDGMLSPCAYIRLLQPLDHPAIGGDFAIVLADAEQALHYVADIVVTQRYAVGDLHQADALIRHCRQHNITLLYDLDDDLLHIPRAHPDAQLLRPKVRLVSRLIRFADAVWVSTPALAARLAKLRPDARVVANGLDERLWAVATPPAPPRHGPVRILFMGTQTHDADFAIVEGALARLHSAFGEYVAVDLLGVTSRRELPGWVNRVPMPMHAATGYPGFVDWITQRHWDIGIAPLADTPFNNCKSTIKTLDYAALGLPVLASDRPAYRGSLADGPGGWLLPDTEDAWFVALARLVRDVALRRRLADGARTALAKETLAAQAAGRRGAWHDAVRPSHREHRVAAAE
jgi:glycosyltransferase involved in cell wall biosynthesis/GT2 family glycosyltransferase